MILIKKNIKTILALFLLTVIFILPIGSTTKYKASGFNDSDLTGINNESFIKIIHQDKIKKIDSILKEKEKRYSFNGNVLVSYHGKILYNNSLGYADPRQKTKLTPEHSFQLASISKQFTAVAILILKQQGALNLTDSVIRFLPDFPYKNITVEMLLNHTSGLPNYMWLLEHKWDRQSAPDNQELIKLLAKHDLNLYFKPGSRYNYSNTGYAVLASIIEKTSNKTYEEFLNKKIFEPLGMNHTFVGNNNHDFNTKITDGFRRWGRSYISIPKTINDNIYGDKGIYSSTGDLYKWDQALYEEKLIPKKLLEKAFTPLMLHGKYKIRYGYGFRIKDTEDGKIVYHNGRWNGFRTSFHRYLEDTTSIVILNNTSRSINSRIIDDLETILFEKS